MTGEHELVGVIAELRQQLRLVRDSRLHKQLREVEASERQLGAKLKLLREDYALLQEEYRQLAADTKAMRQAKARRSNGVASGKARSGTYYHALNAAVGALEANRSKR